MRIDVYITKNNLSESRTQARVLIEKGAVTVNGKVQTKQSFDVSEGDEVVVDNSAVCRYVSRGGLKLEGALDRFGVSPEGLVCVDIGASTGGFTDCLLQRGAKKVYAVDSGTAQLKDKLKNDERVTSIENKNARYLSVTDLGQVCSIAVMDVSFISQTKLYPAISEVLCDGGILISLIKPQFEAGRSAIGKGGIVSDVKTRQKAVSDVVETAAGYGFVCRGVIESPIRGGDGNVEYLGCFDHKKTSRGKTDEN